MKKILTAATAAILLSGFSFAEKGTVYISPNNDGVQDVLEIPLQIKDKRYIKEWSLVVENEKGDVVRTIGNKDKRPSRITFKTFWKSLFTPKSGVQIPSSVAWNGVMDSGEVAPDGNYFYYVTASDDNGNTAATKKLSVVVDNTPPDVEVQQPSGDGKIFGEGAKTLFTVRQNGSSEDEWLGEFTNSEGKVVRTLKWVSSEPLKFDWAGTDDNGAPLPDGIYNYRISAKDRAGNVSSPAGISNIIYSAEKPATNIAVSGSRYFSPNGNGVNDTVSFSVNIPLPDARSGNKLSAWAVDITGSDGKTVRKYESTDSNAENPPKTIVWDGKTDSGAGAGEGEYQAVVTAKYLNGYVPDVVRSPSVVLDTTAPAAKIKVSSLTFSPDGDGNLDTLVISQDIAANSGSPIENWTGKIVDENGGTVREYDFGSNPPASVEWDGLKDDNSIAPDGKYNYVLSASDLSGNSSEIRLETAVALDTTKTELLLAVSPRAFNPASAARGTASSVTLSPVVKSGSAVSSYTLEIKDSAGADVWSQSGNSLPPSFAWNGKSSDGNVCQDGSYTAYLSTKSTNGAEASAKSQNFVIDTVAPTIKLTPEYVLFSPDGDGRKDVLPIDVESSSEDKWISTVTDSNNQTVWSKVYSGQIPSKFEWNGTDSSGNKVADGNYTVAFSSTDAAGNFSSAEVSGVRVDNRETKAYLTADLDAFSPNGDNYLETEKFGIRVSLAEGIESWSFDIVSPEGKTVRQWTGDSTSESSASLPSEIVWDGMDSSNKVAEGVFTANLKINYAKGNIVDVKSSAFICSITPPALAVKTAPQYFSPDNDGENDELYINLKGSDIVPLKSWSFVIKDPENGSPFWTISGKSSITERVVWDGRGNNGEFVQSAMDYPYTFTVTDTLGLTSVVDDKISVDVLVIRMGDVLKMAVPAIIFRQDEADFGVEVLDENGNIIKKGITAAQAKNNERVLKRIAQILNKFKNYTVTVEGHANSVTGLEDEETTNKYGKALVPLSQDRAEFVIEKLKGYGVDGARLSAVGRGGRDPVAKLGDKANAWKNRRVEFILNK